MGEADIAYQVLGEGPLDLVYAHGLTEHLDLLTDLAADRADLDIPTPDREVAGVGDGLTVRLKVASRTSITDTLNHATQIGATDGPGGCRAGASCPHRSDGRPPPRRSPRWARARPRKGLGWLVEDLATVLPGLTIR